MLGKSPHKYSNHKKDGDQISLILTSNAVCAGSNPANSNTLIMKVHSLPEVSWDMADSDFLCVDGEPLMLTGGIPAGGIYSDNGVNNNYFDPWSVTPGGHTLVYTYENETACTYTSSFTVSADPCTGYSSLAVVGRQLTLYPNPVNRQLSIGLEGNDLAAYTFC
jgi:hypothetical protein